MQAVQGKSVMTFGDNVAPITSHAFNGAGDQVAVSKNNKEVEVNTHDMFSFCQG